MLPEAILRPMSEWRFETANAAMTLEAAVFSVVQAVSAELPEVNAATGPVRELVASAKVSSDLQAALDRANEQKLAADLVTAARQKVDAQHDVLVQIGLLGTDLQPMVVAGIAAVTTGDLPATQGQASQIDRALADAPNQGAVRVGATVGLLLLLVLGLALVRRRRRRRPAPLAAASATVAETGGTDQMTPDLVGAPGQVEVQDTGDIVATDVATGDPPDQSS